MIERLNVFSVTTWNSYILVGIVLAVFFVLSFLCGIFVVRSKLFKSNLLLEEVKYHIYIFPIGFYHNVLLKPWFPMLISCMMFLISSIIFAAMFSDPIYCIDPTQEQVQAFLKRFSDGEYHNGESSTSTSKQYFDAIREENDKHAALVEEEIAKNPNYLQEQKDLTAKVRHEFFEREKSPEERAYDKQEFAKNPNYYREKYDAIVKLHQEQIQRKAWSERWQNTTLNK